jgi:hypothetical protein
MWTPHRYPNIKFIVPHFASGVSIGWRFRIGFAMELREAGDVVA